MGNKMFPAHPPRLQPIGYTQPRLRVPSIRPTNLGVRRSALVKGLSPSLVFWAWSACEYSCSPRSSGGRSGA